MLFIATRFLVKGHLLRSFLFFLFCFLSFFSFCSLLVYSITLSVLLAYFLFYIFVDLMSSIDDLKKFRGGCISPHITGGPSDAPSYDRAVVRTPPTIRLALKDGFSAQGIRDSLKQLKASTRPSGFDKLVVAPVPPNDSGSKRSRYKIDDARWPKRP